MLRMRELSISKSRKFWHKGAVMEIIAKRITQIDLLNFEEIPIEKIACGQIAEEIKAAFKFRSAQIMETPDSKKVLICENGLLEVSSKELPITRLVVEERKILMSLEGSSRDSNILFDRIAEFFEGLRSSKKESFMKPIVRSYESTLVARMNIDVDSLLSDSMRRFLNDDLLSSTETETATSSATFSGFSYDIHYHPKTQKLSEYRISLSRKRFTLGPRPGFPIQDRIFQSEAPLETEAHIHLLEDLEDQLS